MERCRMVFSGSGGQGVITAVIGLTEVVRAESIMKTLETRIPPDFLDMNRKALELGLALVKAEAKFG